ncbi:MAG: SDR family NAD(P)-dependent oxidoreductase [Acidimicrobiia bacterium]|jgi:NAD(P)-dependent dehydrogenase (short-subunit alcohol dehydrogenase family)
MRVLSIAGFTNLGYRWHARDHRPITTDMSGQTVLITGATGGLGKAAATGIAALGARTVIVGRNGEKLAQTQRELAGDVVGYQADLSLLSEIRRLAESILAEEGRIDVLINNVGVLLPTREVTDEGIETTLATDLAGHFLLTNLLTPRLLESTPARIVNVTSGGMYSERIRPHDLQFETREYKGTAAYAHAKRGQVILTEMWAERLAGTGVTVNAMHPGWAKTSGVERSLPTFNKLMRPLLRTSAQGADTMVWLASSPDVGRKTGELWFDRELAPKHLVDRTREDPDDRAALWQALVDLTESDMPAFTVTDL